MTLENTPTPPLKPSPWQRFAYIRENVLGMNRRNSEFIFPNNPIEFYQLVDNKILTKNVLSKHDIPTPRLYFTVSGYLDLRVMPDRLKNLATFVIKPANGFGGEGIILINGVSDGFYETPDSALMTLKELGQHVQDILSGLYSLNQLPDAALCEEKLDSEPVLSALTYKGIPDIRVVVYRGVPVMAMLRLSTRRSKGKANLHQGGIGVGVDLTTGLTTHAIHGRKFVTAHPDSGATLTGVEIPLWPKILTMASACFDAAPLGYMGVDIVLDLNHGPMVLELNARPGLMIQMANRRGLKAILTALGRAELKSLSIAQRVELGLKVFSESHLTRLQGR